MAGLTIRGVVGRIEWGYFNAAAINGYTVTRTDGHWRVSGIVVLADSFKLAQQPLLFVAPHAHGTWRWPIVELSVMDGRLAATLLPPLE